MTLSLADEQEIHNWAPPTAQAMTHRRWHCTFLGLCLLAPEHLQPTGFHCTEPALESVRRFMAGSAHGCIISELVEYEREALDILGGVPFLSYCVDRADEFLSRAKFLESFDEEKDVVLSDLYNTSNDLEDLLDEMRERLDGVKAEIARAGESAEAWIRKWSVSADGKPSPTT